MAKIEAFCGVRYNPQLIDDMSGVVCPPYDVITPAQGEGYYQRCPYNIIRLILGKECSGDDDQNNKYTRAAVYFDEWQRRQILIQDEEPAIYVYEQDYTDTDGLSKRRLGFIALMKLDDDGQKQSIYPHEHTHQAPKDDRFCLIKAVEANLSPIFTVFSDPEGLFKDIVARRVRSAKPLSDLNDDQGVRHLLWRVSDAGIVSKIKNLLADKQVFIADGHHRHEVARMFRDHKKALGSSEFKSSYDFIMTYFTVLESEGLSIWPTHRLIKDAVIKPEDFAGQFSIVPIEGQSAMQSWLVKNNQKPGAYGFYQAGRFFGLLFENKKESQAFIPSESKEYRELDVVILHKVLLEGILKVQLPQIAYQVDMGQAVAAVDRGEFQFAFFLNPTRIEQIRAIALSGGFMPQKSTYFYPKLASGLVVHKF